MRTETRTYRGQRDVRFPGAIVVTVQNEGGDPVPLRHWPYHTSQGFDWGNQGEAAADLALAILIDATEDLAVGLVLHQQFKQEYVSHFESEWWLERAEIMGWVKNVSQSEVVVQQLASSRGSADQELEQARLRYAPERAS